MNFNLFRKEHALIQGKEIMTIPSIQDTGNWRQSEKVEAQCKECARLLAGHLYRWDKPWPEKSTLKSWCVENRCFLGMNICDFQNFLMKHFSLRTDDGREWLLDRSVAALIWTVCAEKDSPLPAASWQIEMNRKREAAI